MASISAPSRSTIGFGVRARSGVPVVFATGYGDLPDGRASGGGSSMLLRKPLGRGELETALSRVLATASSASRAATIMA
ncbi:MAG TPA: hypothetical protein VGC80_07240, partial [Acetobacteraceae bacterium]